MPVELPAGVNAPTGVDLAVKSLTVSPTSPYTADPLIGLGGWHIGNGYLISPPPNGTDDTLSLNNILAAVPASGGEVLLQPGLYNAPTGGLICANPVSIQGRGVGGGNSDGAYWHDGITTILITSGNVAGLTLSGVGSLLEKLTLRCSASPTAGGVGVLIPSGGGSGNRYSDVAIRGFYTDLDHQDGTGWFADRLFLYDYGFQGLRVNNIVVADDGEIGISNSLIMGGPVNLHPSAGMRIESGGGIRITGTKFNFRGGAVNYPDHCIDLAVADGVNTGELEITGGGLSCAQIAALRVRLAGTTGTWTGITLQGTTTGPFCNSGRAIQVDPSVAGKISTLAITGNVIRGNAITKPISLSNVSGVSIGGNVYSNPGSGCVLVTDAGVSGLLVAPGDQAGIGTLAERPAASRTLPGSWYYNIDLEQASFSDPNFYGVYVSLRDSRRGDLAYSASITPSALQSDWQSLAVTNGSAFTINAPVNPPDISHTQELTIEVNNASGGAMGVITWNGAFVFAGATWTNPANNKRRWIRFEWNAYEWMCTGVALADYT